MRGMAVFMAAVVAMAMAFAFLPWTGAAEDAASTTVVDLSEATFGDAVRGNAYVLVEFFAPWCGHCKKLDPEYEKAAKIVAEAGSPAVLARVDGTENRKLMEQFRVEGFPTLIFFRKGAPMPYSGPREADGIASWVLAHSGPAMVKIASAEELSDFADKYSTRVVAYIPASDSDKVEAFETFSESPGIVGEFRCALVSDEALFGAAGARVALDRSFDEAVVYGGFDAMTPESLNEWAIENGHPYFESMLVSWKRMVARKLRVAVVFIDENADDVDDVLEWVGKLAKEFHKKFSFGYLTSQYAKEASTLGAGDSPTVVVMPPDARSTWPYKTFGKAFTEENVREWLNLVANGQMEKTMRSDPVPETNDGPVKVVVGTTFDSIVLDTSKHVLIEFYADWCGHCKRLAPVYEELGQHFAKADDVVIAKIEASRNDNTHVEITGFPTLFFFPKGEQKAHPVEFEGERTLEALIEFVDDMRSGKVPAPHAEDEEHSHGDEL